jgi:hypothetical protein
LRITAPCELVVFWIAADQALKKTRWSPKS